SRRGTRGARKSGAQLPPVRRNRVFGAEANRRRIVVVLDEQLPRGDAEVHRQRVEYTPADPRDVRFEQPVLVAAVRDTTLNLGGMRDPRGDFLRSELRTRREIRAEDV